MPTFDVFIDLGQSSCIQADIPGVILGSEMMESAAYSSPATKSAQIAQTLLTIFSAVPNDSSAVLQVGAADQRALWVADALHRANNLAQMSSALGSPGVQRRYGFSVADHAAEARALSRAYSELGAPDLSGHDVPCAPLIEAIASRLVKLFGDARSIDLLVSADRVALPADQRRALTLIASELIINALKYAFAADCAGSISITLRETADVIELSVADNGCGLPVHQVREGSGTSLLGKLTVMLGASMRRTSTDAGLTVGVTMPRLPA